MLVGIHGSIIGRILGAVSDKEASTGFDELLVGRWCDAGAKLLEKDLTLAQRKERLDDRLRIRYGCSESAFIESLVPGQEIVQTRSTAELGMRWRRREKGRESDDMKNKGDDGR